VSFVLDQSRIIYFIHHASSYMKFGPGVGVTRYLGIFSKTFLLEEVVLVPFLGRGRGTVHHIA